MFSLCLENCWLLAVGVTFPFLSVSCAISCFKQECEVYSSFAVSYFEQIFLALGKRSLPFIDTLVKHSVLKQKEPYLFSYYFNEPEVIVLNFNNIVKFCG